jgi:putative membrane protein
MMWGWDGGGGWWAMGIGMVVWLVVVVLAVWLVVRLAGQRSGGGSAESAEELLRRRFASGEIDAEEYDRRLAVLRRS